MCIHVNIVYKYVRYVMYAFVHVCTWNWVLIHYRHVLSIGRTLVFIILPPQNKSCVYSYNQQCFKGVITETSRVWSICLIKVLVRDRKSLKSSSLILIYKHEIQIFPAEGHRSIHENGADPGPIFYALSKWVLF